jgi:hypothetical protein
VEPFTVEIVIYISHLWSLRLGRFTKKADVAMHKKVLNHVGLLFNGPPRNAGLPFI